MIRKSITKITSLLLIIGLNWTGLSAVIETFAYYNDTETSSENSFSAGTLDFSIPATLDFSPVVLPTQTSSRNISLINDGILGFQYTVQASNFTGDAGLCNALNLDANVDGDGSEYNSALTLFGPTSLKTFDSPEDWVFTVNLPSNDAGLQNKTCTFDFVFNGVQIGGTGFSDQEIISNTITSGQWVIPPPPPPSDACIKINEVYYYPGVRTNASGLEDDPNDEWIELYNTCDYVVNIKDWYLEDNGGYGRREKLNHNYLIGPHQFVVIAANASTWTYWPDIPSNAFKIASGGTRMFSYGLRNDGDVVILYDKNRNRIDEVSWGDNVTGLNPAVLKVAKGHSIARKEKGVDTDTAADWEDLSSPNPGTNPHLTNGEEIFQEEIFEEETVNEEPVIEEVPVLEEPASANEEVPAEETLAVEEQPATEEQPVDAPDNDSAQNEPADGNDNSSGSDGSSSDGTATSVDNGSSESSGDSGNNLGE